MKLDDFVKIKEEEARLRGQFRTHFGLDTEGSVMNRWQANIGRIELFTKYRGFDEVAPVNYIQVRVPRTEAGADPSGGEQPFGWDGRINEYAADTMVWWAFELLTEREAADFYRIHRPVVVFEYQERGLGGRLTVQHDGLQWNVLTEH